MSEMAPQGENKQRTLVVLGVLLFIVAVLLLVSALVRLALADADAFPFLAGWVKSEPATPGTPATHRGGHHCIAHGCEHACAAHGHEYARAAYGHAY